MTASNLAYGPLVRELHQLAAINRQPINGTFELTNRCNLACRMCYVRYARSDKTRHNNELSASSWLALARDATDNGMVFLLLTGGEVFLRPDFFDIYEPLTRMGLMITIYTNGTLITEAIAQRLAQNPPSSIQITLYGATSSTYEALTGLSGSFASCRSGIETLLKYQIPLGLKTTITKQNVGELDAMREMAHNWGLSLSAGWLLSMRRDGAPSAVGACRLSAADCVALESTDRASAVEGLEAALRQPTKSSDNNFYCLAGKASFVIAPAGEMNVCLDLPMPSVHVPAFGFSKAWAAVQQLVDSAPPTAPVCLACDARSHCPRCPAWSLLETHTLTEPVPYLCDIAHARKAHYQRQNNKKNT